MASNSSPADTAESDSVSSDDIINFLDKKGSLAILSELIDDSKQFSTLSETIYVSPTTLTRRLEEGRKLGLWYERIAYQGENKIKVYELDDRGEDAASIVEDSDIPSLIEQRRELERQYEMSKNSVFKSIAEG